MADSMVWLGESTISTPSFSRGQGALAKAGGGGVRGECRSFPTHTHRMHQREGRNLDTEEECEDQDSKKVKMEKCEVGGDKTRLKGLCKEVPSDPCPQQLHHIGHGSHWLVVRTARNTVGHKTFRRTTGGGGGRDPEKVRGRASHRQGNTFF